MRKTFTIQKGRTGREVLAILASADKLGYSVEWKSEAQKDSIPIGTVEFCEPAFGHHRKDFYPSFLNHLMLRNHERFNAGFIHKKAFVKDASAWKSDFVSGIYQPGQRFPQGEWIVSEVVNFEQEWRYYVASGKVVTTGWYSGNDEDEPAPALSIEWPEGFSGAVDFGRLDDGRIALVECHAPFACGWYGENHLDYAAWQSAAWNNATWWKQNQ